MKKILTKDKNLRYRIKSVESRHFVLKSIVKNFNYFILVRWNAFSKLKNLSENSSKISVTNRCLESISKKRLNKLTKFSRHTFLKLVRSNQVYGTTKSSW